MAAHAFRHRLPLRPGLALLLLPLIAVLPWPFAVAALAYAALALALRAPDCAPPGDFSYGVYIYGWPVAQTLVHLQPGIGPEALAAASLLLTLPFAVASWYLVERPAIRRAPAVA
jgi:peptidoglycan/LPS O-acetylase OafA/YrhL